MGLTQSPTPIHWNYFLSLEQEVIALSRYIEICDKNSSTYSIELMKLLFSASSEVDVIAKIICKRINKKSKAKNIYHYRLAITKEFPKLSIQEVSMPLYGMELKPWSNWSQSKTPKWWDAYNNVKHERNNYYHEANLKNTLNAIAALYVMLLYFHIDLAQNGTLSPSPEIFTIGGPIGILPLGSSSSGEMYIFPY